MSPNNPETGRRHALKAVVRAAAIDNASLSKARPASLAASDLQAFGFRAVPSSAAS
jgi:hypothetical protein